MSMTPPGRWMRWVLPGSALLMGLLALAWLVPDARPVASMRGDVPAGDELAEVEGLGYYEALINDAPGDPVGEGEGGAYPPGFVPIAEAGLLEFDPGYRRWRLRPGLDARWNGTTFRTNALGYRGPEVSAEKPAGMFRVVVLGSSITMGHGVEDEEGYVRLFGRWLGEKAGPARPVEVVNLAAPGESPSQRLHRLGTEVGRLDPDWVLCDVTPVDVVFEEQHLHSVVSRGVHVPFDYIRDVLDRAELAADASLDQFTEKLRPFHAELLAGAFAGWAEEARLLGVPLTVILLPRTDVRGNSPVLNDLIRSVALRQRLGLADLTAAFDDLEDDELVVGPWDKHPSVRGHRALFLGLRDASSRPGAVPLPGDPRRRGPVVGGGRPHAELIAARRRTGPDASTRRTPSRRGKPRHRANESGRARR